MIILIYTEQLLMFCMIQLTINILDLILVGYTESIIKTNRYYWFFDFSSLSIDYSYSFISHRSAPSWHYISVIFLSISFLEFFTLYGYNCFFLLRFYFYFCLSQIYFAFDYFPNFPNLASPLCSSTPVSLFQIYLQSPHPQ